MQFVRKSFLVLISAAFPILLFATAFDFGVLRVVGSPEPVKKILSASGIYSSIVSSGLDQAQQSAQGDNQIALTNPEVKKAAEESFNPQVVQSSSENIIDGIYNWLNGKAAQPDFNVDLTNTKATFADKVGEAAKNRAASLPVCTSAPNTADPFSVTCLPPGVTPTQVGSQAKNDVLNAQGFLEHPNITASSIKDSAGQSVFSKSKAQNIPKQYQRAKKTPIILAALTVLAILAIIFLSATKRTGLRHVGRTLSIIGVLMLLVAWGVSRVATHNIIPKLSLDNNVLKSSVQKLANEVVHSISQNYLLFGGTYLALGIVALLCAHFIGREAKPVKPQSSTAEKPSESPSHKSTPKPAARPKSPPKVQG